jgi:signal transduction histidine kinase
MRNALIGFLGMTVVFALLLRSETLFGIQGFEPHAHCFLYDPLLMRLYVGSDMFIGLSYTAIAATLIYVVNRAQKDIPFNWIVVAFGTFIFACGITHFIDIWTLWTPDYWLDAGFKVITAVASVTTAVALPPLVPRLLRLIADAKVSRQRKAQLEALVVQYELEVAERRRAEEAVRLLNADLEQRVQQRTAELETANHLKDELLIREQALREKAEAADQLKVKFLGMISHELRTPLTSIKGFSSTLLADDIAVDQANQRDFIRIIDSEADRLTTLVEQLLDVSRLEAGTFDVFPQRQTLPHLFERVQERLRLAAENHPIVIDPLPDLPPVLMDEPRMEQVLFNLVSNAARYAPPHTPITLRASQAGHEVQIDVIDLGEGIASEDREIVFEAFRRVEKRGTTIHKGAGLGLAICKGIVEAHGGRIWIQEHASPGTIISFTLPTVGLGKG